MKIFIGSSSESKESANKVARILKTKGVTASVWDSSDDFVPSQFLLESLERATEKYDGAIFIFAKDDIVKSRKKKSFMPRDNVLFEMGLFMGKLGHKNVAAICTSAKIKKMSDLLGFTTINDYSNYNLEHQLEQWLKNLSPISTTLIMSRKEIDKDNPLEERWKYAKEIIMVNYASSSFLTASKIASNSVYGPNYKTLMYQKLQEGVDFKFLMTKPGSYAAFDAAQYKMKIVSKSCVGPHDAINLAAAEIQNLCEQYKKNKWKIDYKFTDISLPYAAMLVINDEEHSMSSSIKVDLYSPNISNDRERRSFIIYPTNANYEFFYNNITELWNGGTKNIGKQIHLSTNISSCNVSNYSCEDFKYEIITFNEEHKEKDLFEIYSTIFINILEGEILLEINGDIKHAFKGDAIVIPKQNYYSYTAIKGTSILKLITTYK